jgi:hypothetical protein
LCAYHGLKHGFNREIWWLDMALLCRRCGCEPLEAVVGWPAGQVIVQELVRRGYIPRRKRGWSPSLRQRLLSRLLSGTTGESTGEFALALSAPSWGLAIGYCIRSLFPPWSVLRQMYGDHHAAILLLIRLVRLFQFIPRILK